GSGNAGTGACHPLPVGIVGPHSRSIDGVHIRYNHFMRRNVFVLAFVLAIPALLPAKDPKWIEVSSDHFLLFTDTNEMKGRRLVSDFENRVAAFSEAFGTVPPRQFPIEIFLFNQ